jgi:hypothetical protein
MLDNRHQHFNPWAADGRPCWHCIYFDAMVYQGSAAACRHKGGPRIRSAPANGCSAWEREVGADDETGPPASRPFVPVPRVTTAERVGRYVR